MLDSGKIMRAAVSRVLLVASRMSLRFRLHVHQKQRNSGR